MAKIDNMEDEPVLLLEDTKKLLKEKDFPKVLAFCCDKENQDEVSECGWDLLALLMQYLKEEKVNDDDLTVFQQIFSHIASLSKAKEILLAILEQFDPMIDVAIVELLFPALNIVCTRLVLLDKRNHCHNLGMTFSSLNYFAEGLNLPKYNDYEPAENDATLEELKISKFVLDCTKLGISLMKEIITLFDNKEIHDAHFKAVKLEFMNFCSGLLERLSFLDMDEPQPRKQDAMPVCSSCNAERVSDESTPLPAEERQSVLVAYELCSCLRLLHAPWSLLCHLTWERLHRSDRKLSKEELEKIALSRAFYLYLTLLKENESSHFPQVANPEFVFIHCIPSLLQLWKTSNSVLVHKGLELCRCVTNRLEPLTLNCGYINHNLKHTAEKQPVNSLLLLAVQIATRCPSRTLRKRAAQFLTRFLDKFSWMDRYNLLYFLLTNVSHCGIAGYLTVYFKDKLAEVLQDPVPPNCHYFMERSRLSRLLDVCFALADGSETDLLSEYDRLMASLNLLRFLFIRDAKNMTGVWDRSSSVEKNFLEPLRTGINLSRMHFRDELERQSKPKTDDCKTPDFTINGLSLTSLPPKDRRQALESAVHSFDMMQAVCIRVQQLIDERDIFR